MTRYTDRELLHRCWADSPQRPGVPCKRPVPPDEDHIGLCERCLNHLKGLSPAQTREDAA